MAEIERQGEAYELGEQLTVVGQKLQAGEPAPDFVSHHDGAVMPAGAAERNRQVALSFLDIVRQQVDEKLRDPLDKLDRLWE